MADWSLLPASPLRFFGLAENFDRKQLKRAYGALIKQFRPETHPAEFQRIREAYEFLENQDRYGIIQTQLQQASSAWSSVTRHPQPAAAATDRAPRNIAAEWFDPDTAAAAPLPAYKRLKMQSSKSPQDYFALATLSDLVEPRSANMYLKWLLTGVKEHPHDPGLLRLLSEYLSAFTDSTSAAGTLQTIAKLIGGDDFYRVTEPLWDRLLRDVEFSHFEKTLDACERLLQHRSLRPRLAFYIHVLRLALWKAPSTWIEERLKYIEAHGSELGNGFDDDIELVRLLHRYRHQDRPQVIKSAVGSRIDKLIIAYCQGNSPANLAEATLVIDELARNGNGWRQTFSAAEREKFESTLWLCLLIVADVAQQTGVEFGPANRPRMQQQADATVSDIVKTVQEVSNRIHWLSIRTYCLPFLVVWLGPLILTIGWSQWSWMVVIWSLVAGLAYAALAIPFYLKKRVEQRTRKLVEHEYENLWRPRMFRYVQACHAPAQVSIAELEKSAYDLGQSNIIGLVLAFAQGDRAMHLFNLMQLFVR